MKYFTRTIYFLFFLMLLIVAGKAEALTISPPVSDFSVDPGQTASGEIKIFNETAAGIILFSSIENFDPKSENDSRQFDPSRESQKGFLQWFSLDSGPIVLEPGQSKIIKYNIAVPKTAEVGSYYGAILWQAAINPDKPESSVGIASRVGSLVFLNVNGEQKIQSEIKSFVIAGGRHFFTHLPVNFFTEIKNSGNIYIQPQGQIIIKNIFGLTSASLPLNPGKSRILPEQSRSFASAWEKSNLGTVAFLLDFWPGLRQEITNFTFGYYRAYIDIAGQNQSGKIRFFVVPIRIIIVLLVILITLFIIKRFFRRRLINKK